MIFNRPQLLATTVLAGLMASVAPAFAQATNPTPETVAVPQAGQTQRAADQTNDATTVEEVVVTGSRIRRNEFNSAQPVQVITSETTDLRGIPDAAQALLTSTLAVSSFQLNDQLTGFVTAGGGGTQSACAVWAPSAP